MTAKDLVNEHKEDARGREGDEKDRKRMGSYKVKKRSYKVKKTRTSETVKGEEVIGVRRRIRMVMEIEGKAQVG